MSLKRKLTTILALVLIPPAVGLALAMAVGWLRFELSWGGVLLVLGAYASWIAVLGGLSQVYACTLSQPAVAPIQTRLEVQPTRDSNRFGIGTRKRPTYPLKSLLCRDHDR